MTGNIKSKVKTSENHQLRKDSYNEKYEKARLMTKPEYVENSDRKGMKRAEILDPFGQNKGNIIHNTGLTESVSYLSTVLSYHPSSIFTKTIENSGSPTFDLDTIKKRRFHEKNDQVVFNINPKSEINRMLGRNMPLRSKKDLNSPPSGPVSINHSMSTVNKYKMNLLFHGQSKTSLNQNSSSVMKIVEKKLKNIEKMDKKKINDLIQTMNQEKSFIEKENDMLYSTMSKSENQINLVLNSLKDDLRETKTALNSMIIPVPNSIKPLVFKEIFDEYTKSLSGYNIDKSKYPNLKNIDAKELISISEKIKKKLSGDKNFFLQNDDFSIN